MATTDTTSGKWIRVRIAGTILRGVQEWNCNETGDVLDRTSADDDGYGSTDTGVDELEFTIQGIHKIADGPFPSMYRGLIMNNVYLYANRDSATATWYMGEAIVTKVNHTTQIRGQIKYTLDCKSRGSYTRPTA